MKKIIIPFLVLSILLSCKTTKKAVQETPVVEPVAEVIDEPVKEEPSVIMPVSEEPIIIKTEEVQIIEEEKPPMKPTFDFFVIIGSFLKPDNAEKCKVDMLKKGFSPVLLSTESGFFRVAVEQTNSESDARTFIKAIRERYPEHKDIWLLKKK